MSRIPFKTLRHVTLAVLLSTVLAGAVSAQPVALPTAEQAFDAALAHYERSHWSEAYAALVVLADRGHPQAARMALDMWRFGRRLYGTTFVAAADQVARWTQLWGCDGDATSRACLQALAAP